MAKQYQTPDGKVNNKAVSKPMFGLSVQNAGALLVFVFSFLIYANSIFNDYNMDDELVTRNHRLTSKGISAIPEILTSPYYQDKAGYEYEYRPMVLISFAIEKSFIGEGPKRSHFINVLMYSFMCTFLFLLLRKLFSTYSIIFPLLATIIYAAHPIHTEVVASIKNRDEIMAMFFGLSAIWFAVRYAEEKTWWQLALVPIMMLLAMLSKSTAITFVVLVPLALVLLTQANLASILLVVTLLLPPALVLARLYAVVQVAGLAVAVYAVVLALYALKNAGGLVESIQYAMANLKASAPTQQAEEETANEKFAFIKYPIVFVPFVLACGLALAISAFGIYLGNAWLMGLPLLLLGAIYIGGNRAMQLVVSVPILLLGVYLVARMGGGAFSFYSGLVLGFIAILVLDKDRKFNIVGWLGYALFAAVSIFILHQSLFIGLLLFVGIYNRRLLMVSLVLIALTASWFVYKSIGASQLDWRYVSFLILYAVFAALYFSKGKYAKQALVLLLPIAATVYFSLNPVNNYRSVSSAIDYTYTNIRNVNAPDITPVKANRELIYHEWPFDGSETVSTKLGTAFMVLGRYLKMTFIPYPMSFYYGYPYLDKVGMSNPGSIVSLLLHLVLLGIALFYVRGKPIIAFGILFYLVSISPYSGLLVPVPGIMADRFLLVPSIGFALLFVYLLSVLFKNVLSEESVSFANMPSGLKGALVVILLAYSGLTIARNQDWENHVQLFSKDIKVVPNSAQGQYLLGVHLFRAAAAQNDIQKRMALSEQAIEHYKQTTRLYAPFMNPWYDIGNTYTLLGEQYASLGDKRKGSQCFDSAMVYYENAVRIKPDFTKPYFTMGRLEQSRGNLAKAVEYYEKYVERFPDQLDAASNLSYTYFMLKQYDKAIGVNMRYLDRNPNTYEPIVNIGKTYLEQNMVDSALVYFEKAYDMNRNNATMVKFMYDLSTRKGDAKRIEYYGRELNRVAVTR